MQLLIRNRGLHRDFIYILIVFGLLIAVNVQSKSLIYRAVVIDRLVWIVKHPSGAEIIGVNNCTRQIPESIDLSKILDVMKYNQSTMVVTKDVDRVIVHELSSDLNLISSRTIDQATGEVFLRLISYKDAVFIITNKRIVNLEENTDPVQLKWESSDSEKKRKSWFKKQNLISNHLCFDNEIYFGVSLGEFGGGFVSINLNSGLIRCSNNLGSATDLILSGKFASPFYISTGCTHIGISGGDIFGGSKNSMEMIFSGNHYTYKLLGLESSAIFPVFTDGVPIVGMFKKEGELLAVTEQNYIINITSPLKVHPQKIEYKKHGNYYLHWISDECVIINFEHYLPNIRSRSHVRFSEFAAEDDSFTNFSINQTIIVARE